MHWTVDWIVDWIMHWIVDWTVDWTVHWIVEWTGDWIVFKHGDKIYTAARVCFWRLLQYKQNVSNLRDMRIDINL